MFPLLFPTLPNSNGAPEVGVATDNGNTDVSVYSANLPDAGSWTANVPDRSTVFLTLSNNVRGPSSQIGPYGVTLSSGLPTSVFAFNTDGINSDGYLAFPEESLGREYYVVTYAPTGNDVARIGVVAIHSTTVSFAFPSQGRPINVVYNGQTYTAGSVLQVNLNSMQSIILESSTDLTGTRVYACQKIAVYSGNREALIGEYGTVADHMMIQLPPTTTWGTTFGVQMFPERTDGYVLTIVAAQDTTTFTLSGQGTIFLHNAGDFYSIDINRYAGIVSSDKPILVVQYSKSSQPGYHGDASMLLIPPTEQFATDYTFATPMQDDSSWTHHIMLVSEQSTASGIVLSSFTDAGQSDAYVENTDWFVIPESNPVLVAKSMRVDAGRYRLYHIPHDVPFQAFLFGNKMEEEYALPLGMRMQPLNAEVSILVMVL